MKSSLSSTFHAAILVTSLTAACLPVLAADDLPVVYQTGFEAPDFTPKDQLKEERFFDRWYGSGDGGSCLVRITEEDAHSGTQSLMLEDRTDKDTPFAGHTMPETLSAAEVTVAVKTVVAGTAYRIDFRNDDAVSFMIVHGWSQELNSMGFFVVTNKGGTQQIIKTVADSEIGYNPTEWNVISCRFDDKTKTFALSINGKVALSMENAAEVDWKFNRLYLATGYLAGNSPDLKAWFDDLVIAGRP